MRTLHAACWSCLWYGVGVLLVCLMVSCIVLPMGVTSVLAATHQGVSNQHVQPPCLKNGCDNVDPAGRCDSVRADGICLGEYPKDGSYEPTPTSCQQSNFSGGRLALIHPTAANIGLVLTNITVNGKPESERLAIVRLLYSEVCGANWVDILPLGRCLPQGNSASPCTFTGWMQRSPTDQRDGDSTPVPTLPMSSQGTTHSTMLWAPDVGVQGCASAVYPDPIAGGTNFATSPLVCVKQIGF